MGRRLRCDCWGLFLDTQKSDAVMRPAGDLYAACLSKSLHAVCNRSSFNFISGFCRQGCCRIQSQRLEHVRQKCTRASAQSQTHTPPRDPPERPPEPAPETPLPASPSASSHARRRTIHSTRVSRLRRDLRPCLQFLSSLFLLVAKLCRPHED